MTTYQQPPKAEMNLKAVNITEEIDWAELKSEWVHTLGFDSESFNHVRDVMSQVNIVVGFGQGFWSGVTSCYYLVYHPQKDQFFWYLRDVDKTDFVSFCRIRDDKKILQLLKTKGIEAHYNEYDREVDFIKMYNLSKRKVGIFEKSEVINNTLHTTEVQYTDVFAPEYEYVSLEEIFGEDTRELRCALSLFYPGATGNSYPHIVYQEGHFKPFFIQHAKEMADWYNQKEKHVFSRKQDLFIEIDGTVFKLQPTAK